MKDSENKKLEKGNAERDVQIIEVNKRLIRYTNLLTAVQSSLTWKVLTRVQLARYGRLVKRSGLFERNYYLSLNPDVATAGVDPLRHYFSWGAYEGRDPHPLFDSSYYLSQNSDVAKAGVNPLVHYLIRGAYEGRSPHPLFDSGYYLSQNPDVARAKVNPLAHYIAHGGTEGRCPHPAFDSKQYLRDKPDVAASRINPLLHFLASQTAGAHRTLNQADSATESRDAKLRMLAALQKLSDALTNTSTLVSVIIPCFQLRQVSLGCVSIGSITNLWAFRNRRR